LVIYWTSSPIEGRPVRLFRNGDLWFVLADVCQALGYTAAGRLDADEKGLHSMETPGGPQEMLIVSEPGLYKLNGSSWRRPFGAAIWTRSPWPQPLAPCGLLRVEGGVGPSRGGDGHRQPIAPPSHPRSTCRGFSIRFFFLSILFPRRSLRSAAQVDLASAARNPRSACCW
jgi:BRO family protein